MVRVELGGTPILDLSAAPGESGQLKKQIRRQMRGGSTRTSSVKASWQHNQPKLLITSDTDDFDDTLISHFQQEGFQTSYLAYDGDHQAYHNALSHLADNLEPGDRYAIVAYGDAAALCLEACTKPMPKLCSLVAYYPPYTPQPSPTRSTTPLFPPTLAVQIHLPSSAPFGATHHPTFRYPSTTPGFAEHDLSEYDKTSFTLAWSRTIGILRRSFSTDVNIDLESIWDHHTALEFETKDADATMATMVPEPYVNHVPTMTGGIGATDLRRFYADYFIPGNPESLQIKLLSRTVGTDRVVDEMLCTFRHTSEIPWMLPGVPATDKQVEVVLVSVVCIRGGKLYHEHIHWDQATVLVQIGLLDPNLVPDTFKTSESGREKDVKRLPVVGREGARKAVDEKVGESNQLIPDWKHAKQQQQPSRAKETRENGHS